MYGSSPILEYFIYASENLYLLRPSSSKKYARHLEMWLETAVSGNVRYFESVIVTEERTEKMVCSDWMMNINVKYLNLENKYTALLSIVYTTNNVST